MNTNYEIVDTCESKPIENFSWKYFLRQLAVCSVIWVNFLLYGICIGAPTVYIPQIRKEANSTDAVSEDMASWLTSIYGYGSIPWSIILPIFGACFGQKISHILITINSFAAFTFFYLSSNVTEIFISQVMESVIGASLCTISVSVITEFTSPQYRGIFLTFKSATFFWGLWISNAIGTFYHWKNIALLKLVLSIYPLIAVFFWPESPYWLASKRYLDKCAESHRWLKGSNAYSEMELEQIIESQNTTKETRSWTLNNIFTKEFIKLTLLCFCVLGFYTLSGKITCGFYSLDIIKKMTSSESTAYSGMLLLDGLSVLGMYIGTLLSKFVKRRYLFFGASIVGVLSLLALGVYTYLIHASILIENVNVSLVLLSVYSIGICCGPMIFCSSLYAELLPLKFRSLAMSMVSLYDKILMGTIVKFAPLVMKKFGLHAAFFFFGITSAISLVLLYKYMPETKDKTLAQIAEEIKGVDSSKKINLSAKTYQKVNLINEGK